MQLRGLRESGRMVAWKRLCRVCCGWSSAYSIAARARTIVHVEGVGVRVRRGLRGRPTATRTRHVLMPHVLMPRPKMARTRFAMSYMSNSENAPLTLQVMGPLRVSSFRQLETSFRQLVFLRQGSVKARVGGCRGPAAHAPGPQASTRSTCRAHALAPSSSSTACCSRRWRAS